MAASSVSVWCIRFFSLSTHLLDPGPAPSMPWLEANPEVLQTLHALVPLSSAPFPSRHSRQRWRPVPDAPNQDRTNVTQDASA